KSIALVPSADFIHDYESGAKKARLAAWAMSGAAAAGIGTAVLFNVLSASTESSLIDKRAAYSQGSSDTTLLAQMQSLHDRGQTQVAVARVGLAVGLVAAACAAYFWITGDDPHRYESFRETSTAQPGNF